MGICGPQSQLWALWGPEGRPGCSLPRGQISLLLNPCAASQPFSAAQGGGWRGAASNVDPGAPQAHNQGQSPCGCSHRHRIQRCRRKAGSPRAHSSAARLGLQGREAGREAWGEADHPEPSRQSPRRGSGAQGTDASSCSARQREGEDTAFMLYSLTVSIFPN